MTRLGRATPVALGLLAAAALVAVRSSLDGRDVVRGFDLMLLVAMAVAWNLVGGYGGLFSVGHSIFVGAGAYTTAMLVIHAELPLGVTIALSGVLSAGLAVVVGLPLMRLRAAYFAVASLGIALAVQAWMLNWEATGASTGVNMPISAYVDPSDQYLLAVLTVTLTVAVAAGVVRGGLGLRLMALRDDEDAAGHIGIRRLPVALSTWAISGGLTGVAGALIALQKSSLEPVSAFSLSFTLDMIVASVIGGLGTVPGPIIGAVVVYVVRQRFQDSGSWATLVNGLLIVAVIRFAPQGCWGVLRAGARRLWQAAQPIRTAHDPAMPPSETHLPLERTMS